MTVKSLIINSPWVAPARHWRNDRDRLVLTDGRRPAGYEILDTVSFTRRHVTLDLVNRIRERVEAWRGANWPGVTF